MPELSIDVVSPEDAETSSPAPQRRKHYAEINYAKCTDNSTSSSSLRGSLSSLNISLKTCKYICFHRFLQRPSLIRFSNLRLSSGPTRRSNKKSRGRRNGHEVTRWKGRKAVHENSELTSLYLGFLRVNRTHVARNILSWVSTPRELRYRSPSSIVPFPLVFIAKGPTKI